MERTFDSSGFPVEGLYFSVCSKCTPTWFSPTRKTNDQSLTLKNSWACKSFFFFFLFKLPCAAENGLSWVKTVRIMQSYIQVIIMQSVKDLLVILHILGNINIKFCKAQECISYLPYIHARVKSSILCTFFLKRTKQRDLSISQLNLFISHIHTHKCSESVNMMML